MHNDGAPGAKVTTGASLTTTRGTAVVGGGFFGACAALELAARGDSVDLFERGRTLLGGTSGHNSRRLHSGFHYPRSPETVTEIQKSVEEFRRRFPEAVVDGARHYVAIAREGSRVGSDAYLRFCDAFDLKYREEWPSFLRREAVDISIRIEEAMIDLDALRRVCLGRLERSGVRVLFGRPATAADLARYRQIVVAAYTSENLVRLELTGTVEPLRFDVYELPIVELPSEYDRTSVLILDGPFVNLAPFDDNGGFVLGDVSHGIRATTVGISPLIPANLSDSVDRGVVREVVHNSARSRFGAFVGAGRRYFAGFEKARHLGSIFSVRAVLPSAESTDSRATKVRRIDDRVVLVFGGKLAAAILAARQAADLVEAATPSVLA
ncbi:MAG: FAD-dependent oxidoreductase [Micromonosporaceae bacterium]